jgi:DNA-binding XRE family transcriptional regulator
MHQYHIKPPSKSHQLLSTWVQSLIIFLDSCFSTGLTFALPVLHRRGAGMKKPTNNVKTLRENQLMSKAELARKAGISALTVDRVEAGQSCRLDTKRKIILALGMTVADKDRVFGASDADDSTVAESAATQEE